MQSGGRQHEFGAGRVTFSVAMQGLVGRVEGTCESTEEWPAKVGAGLYVALDYLLERPEVAHALLVDPSASPFGEPFRRLIRRMSRLLDEVVPLEARPGPGTPGASLAGIGLVVVEYARAGRLDQLDALRPDFHLLVLLPFLGFAEAKSWVDSFQVTE